MRERSRKEKSKTPGEVRIRSNVCTDQEAWHLVPGDVGRKYLSSDRLSLKQKDEAMYYVPCSICHRSIFAINEDGCDHPICLRQDGMLSSGEAKRQKMFRPENS